MWPDLMSVLPELVTCHISNSHNASIRYKMRWKLYSTYYCHWRARMCLSVDLHPYMQSKLCKWQRIESTFGPRQSEKRAHINTFGKSDRGTSFV